MKPQDFEVALCAFSDVLSAAGANSLAANLRRVATIFARSPEKTTAATLKKLDDMVVASHGASSVELHRLATVLRTTKAFSARISGSKFAGLVESLSNILDRNRSASVESVVTVAVGKLTAPKGGSKKTPIVRDDIVNNYVRRLQELLGDERFIGVYRQLEEDRSLTPAEVVAVARLFTVKKAATRPTALKAIWGRHHSLVTFRAKSDSRAGRSAA